MDEIINKFIQWVRASNTVCIVTHRNADPDATASVLAIIDILKSINHGGTYRVLLPEGLDKTSKVMLESLSLNMPLIDSSDIVCDKYIIVDTASDSQLGSFWNEIKKKEFIIIDHHDINELVGSASLTFYNPERKSTSELALSIAKKLRARIQKNVLTALIVGILYDTKFFRLADDETFKCMYMLMRDGGDYNKALKILTKKEVDYSEKVAKLKGISRAGIYSVGNYLLAITCIGAYESSVLKLLIDAGADVAIAIAIRRKEGARITIRASERIVKESKTPVAAELSKILGEKFYGSGGGHSQAAGAQLKVYDSQEFLKIVKEYFTTKGLDFRVLYEGNWVRECE